MYCSFLTCYTLNFQALPCNLAKCSINVYCSPVGRGVHRGCTYTPGMRPSGINNSLSTQVQNS